MYADTWIVCGPAVARPRDSIIDVAVAGTDGSSGVYPAGSQPWQPVPGEAWQSLTEARGRSDSMCTTASVG